MRAHTRTEIASLATNSLQELAEKHGNCAGSQSDAFFAPELESRSPAVRQKAEAVVKRWCVGCPVRDLCLEIALRSEGDRGETPYGIWGGMTVAQRLPLIRARRDRIRQGREVA